jgi:TPR repeat protein
VDAAQYAMGVMAENGFGMPRPGAGSLASQGGHQGNTDAQFNLGAMRHGVGMPPDPAEAAR